MVMQLQKKNFFFSILAINHEVCCAQRHFIWFDWFTRRHICTWKVNIWISINLLWCSTNLIASLQQQQQKRKKKKKFCVCLTTYHSTTEVDCNYRVWIAVDFTFVETISQLVVLVVVFFSAQSFVGPDMCHLKIDCQLICV